MGDYSKCKWCGKTFEKGGLNKFKGAWTMGIAGKEAYCSTRCETEATGGSGANQSQVSAAQPIYQAPPKTEAEIAYEIERKRKEDEKRDERNKKAEIRKEEKIRKYEQEGKKFLLFITEKPILEFVLFFAVFPVVVFFISAIISKNGPVSLLVGALPMLLFLGLYLKDSMKK
jgi:hypothetical protein